MQSAIELRLSYRAIGAHVDRTTGQGNLAIETFAADAKQFAQQGKEQIKEWRETNLERLSTEVARSNLARTLINLLI